MGRSSAGRDQLRLAGEVRITPDEVGRAVEDPLVRAAVVGQGQAPTGEAPADVVDLRVAPAVDRLLGVADRGHVAESVRRHETYEVELDAVRILELVDYQVAESLAASPPKLGHALERVDDLQEQVVEVAQPLFMEPVFVRAVDRVEDIDRLALGTRGVGTARGVHPLRPGPLRGAGHLPMRWGGRTARPVLSMQIRRTLPEALRINAPALQLEEKAQARPQQVVEIVDRQGAEGVRVEWRGFPAAKSCDELLLEKLLARLVEDAHLARRADQVRELVEQPRADAVKGPDPRGVERLRAQARPARGELQRDPLPQLLGGAFAECHGQDLVWRDALLDEPAEPLGRGEGLACAWSCGDQEGALRTRVRGRGLLATQRRPGHAQGAHSGGAPP